jgi:3-oxoacyl-[acyl-carrier protein] reductase
MTQRTILITGGNGGLGQAIAQSFLAEATENVVWLGVRSNRQRLDDLVLKFPERCFPVQLDVTRAEDWRAAVEEIVEKCKRLDVLVNNAGSHQDSLLANMTATAWTEVLKVNLDGAFLGCQATLPTMVGQRHGRIINIASLSALVAPAGQTNYAAAKAGVIALTRSLAKEVARLGITVNVICPGYIETEALAGLNAEERRAAQARVPMRRFGRPEEVAVAVRFLACAEASYITGSIVKIDGGIL